MKTTVLTAAQQTQAVTLKASLIAAQTAAAAPNVALATAQKNLQTFLANAAGVSVPTTLGIVPFGRRFSLSDDGTTVYNV